MQNLSFCVPDNKYNTLNSLVHSHFHFVFIFFTIISVVRDYSFRCNDVENVDVFCRPWRCTDTWDEVVPVLKAERGGQEPEQRYRDSGDSASESEAEMETGVSRFVIVAPCSPLLMPSWRYVNNPLGALSSLGVQRNLAKTS